MSGCCLSTIHRYDSFFLLPRNRKKRKENQFAWKVNAGDIIANNYNLDIKNPNTVEEDHGDPEEILQKYNAVEKEIAELREKLKNELKEALS